MPFSTPMANPCSRPLPPIANAPPPNSTSSGPPISMPSGRRSKPPPRSPTRSSRPSRASDRPPPPPNLAFERPADLHAQWQKVKAAAALADSLVQPIPRLRAIILQKAAKKGVKAGAPHLDSEMWVDEAASSLSSRSAPLLPSRSEGGVPGERSLLAGVQAEGSASPGTAMEPEPAAAVFLLHSGCLTGPARLSVLGVRAVKEQTSVGSSLFAQPLMLQAIPLEEESPNPRSEEH